MKIKSNNRNGIAAVEAGLCLPLLILIWLGSYEMVHTLALKQQGQLLCTTAANRVIDSSTDFETIESEILNLSEAIGVVDCEITIQRLDPEIVESVVTIDYARNSALASIFSMGSVSSSYYSYRVE